MAVTAHRDVWPLAASRSTDIATREAQAAHDALRRAVAAAGPVDEALAWLTQELDLSDDDLDALCEAIGYPSRELSRTAIVLARRLLAAAGDGRTDTDGDLAGDGRCAALTVVLGARYSEVGRWDEARRHTEQAVQTFRLLTDLDRDRYLPDLAGGVSNLASCLAQLGERDEALNHSYEAVTLHRELVGMDADRHLPELARALTNLAACLSRSHRRTAALGAAGQAVALYRRLVEGNPTGYVAELAAAEHNWRVCLNVLGERDELGDSPLPERDPAPA
jgi:tetratricopeptide (TPR) repeat protein